MLHSAGLMYLGLAALGFSVGGYGTLMGAGGGFMLMPLLLLLYPSRSPSELAAVSLACILINTTSGGTAYARMKRIDYKSALLFATTTIPGSLLGTMATAYVPRRAFEGVFAAFLLALGGFLFLKPKTDSHGVRTEHHSPSTSRNKPIIKAVNGIVFEYGYNRIWGMTLFFFLGVIVSFLGIGGGALIVPTLIYLLGFPIMIASGTSTLIIAIVCFTSTLMHTAIGSFDVWGVQRVAAIGIGMLIGAQGGAWLSNRIKGVWIVRSLAAALAAVGVRMLFIVI
jgi:uncharacterized protein